MIDEGPSPEDIERFDRDVAYCPDCGSEIWDAADVCPKCYAYVGGETVSRKPVEKWFQQRWILLIILALLAAFAFIWIFTAPAGN